MQTLIPQLTEPARRWVRFIALLVVLGLLCWIAYRLRTVFIPILAGLALAYILNPAVTWFERRWRVPRLTTVIVAFGLTGALLLGGGLYVGARTVAQISRLADDLPTYRARIETWLAAYANQAPATAPTQAEATSQPAAAWRDFLPLLEQHGAAVARELTTRLTSLLASTVNIATLLFLLPMYTFFFLWRFNEMVAVVERHLPAAYRAPIVQAVRTIDAAMSNFFRGRLIVCGLIALASALGWSLVPGQHYGLPLGLLAGVLSLVPFMSLLALPPALLTTWLGTPAESSWAIPLTLTLAVYLAVQALESFVFSPLVEGRASGLHPLAIVVALFIGGELAGLLGMLLAIPVASTLKTFAVQLVLPEIRRLAGLPETSASAAASPSQGAAAAPASDSETG